MSSHPPATLDDLARHLDTLPQFDGAAAAAVAARDAQLTKPAGSLGRLELIAAWYAGWRGVGRPLQRVRIQVFVGWHGVVRHGVSPFPAEVTGQMVANFQAGGAAINQLCAVADAELEVQALRPGEPTGDLLDAPAMSEAELIEAVAAGFASVDPGLDLIGFGEMGIGNTTSAACLCASLFGGGGSWAGPGTGLDTAGVARKARVVEAVLARHEGACADPWQALRHLGGRELAAIAGGVLAARLLRIPVLLDGFVATAAAAVLARSRPHALDHCLAAHRSAEPGHDRLLRALELVPLLDLGMRLGEGSGAALAVPMVRAALACHAGMATFEEAGVAGRDSPQR